MYDLQWPWEQIKSFPFTEETPMVAAMFKLFAQCSPMFVFDTWLAQVDHDDHPHNIICGYNPNKMSESLILFIDFAYSMGFDGRWDDGKWKVVKPARFPALMLEHLDADLVEKTVAAIEALPEETIMDVVGRIDDFWIPAQQRALLQEALIERRKLLRGCVEV